MVLLPVLVAILLSSCAAPPPAPVAEQPKPDPTRQEWYGRAAEQLTGMNREAKTLLDKGRSDEAAAVITKGQEMQARLLSAPRPTLAAMEAASDLDQLYGRMLLANGRYGWARLVFQKNVTRWKTWKPQTAETAQRLKEATSAIAECDRRLAQ